MSRSWHCGGGTYISQRRPLPPQMAVGNEAGKLWAQVQSCQQLEQTKQSVGLILKLVDLVDSVDSSHHHLDSLQRSGLQGSWGLNTRSHLRFSRPATSRIALFCAQDGRQFAFTQLNLTLHSTLLAHHPKFPHSSNSSTTPSVRSALRFLVKIFCSATQRHGQCIPVSNNAPVC